MFSIRTKDRQTDWFMRINPNGEEKTCKGFVSLFLYKDGNCEVKVFPLRTVHSSCWIIRILPCQYIPNSIGKRLMPPQVPINADIIFSIVDKDGVKTRAKRCEYTFEKNLPSDNRGFAKWVLGTILRRLSVTFLFHTLSFPGSYHILSCGTPS